MGFSPRPVRITVPDSEVPRGKKGRGDPEFHKWGKVHMNF